MISNCLVLVNSCWEMLLKAFEQLLGTAKMVQESRWEMPNGYWIASWQFLEGIGKPLGNAQIPAARREGRIAQRLLAKTRQFPSLFF
jgi:hypothetical protein